MVQECAHSRGGCTSRSALKRFWGDHFNGLYLYQGWQSGVDILDLVRCAIID